MENENLELPLDSIFADYSWNVRSIAEVQSKITDGVYDTTGAGGEQGEGLPGLIASLKASGQDNEIVVRKIEKGITLQGIRTDKEYELIAGFRRYAAFLELNTKEAIAEANKDKKFSVPNVKNGHIRAKVRTCSHAEARLLNVRENTERSQLKTPDLVFAVRELEKCGMTQELMAEGMGVSRSWISMLASIGSLPKVVLAHWREGIPFPQLPASGAWRQLTTQEMWALAKRRRREDLATEEYVKLLTVEKKDGRKRGGKSGSYRKRILGHVRVIAELVKVGALHTTAIVGGNTVSILNWAEIIGPKAAGFPLDCGMMTREELVKVWKEAENLYREVLARSDENE